MANAIIEYLGRRKTRLGINELLREKRQEILTIAALITLKPPTKAMREEAAAADFYVWEGPPVKRFPRLQILTIAELFAGKKLEYPWWAPPETFKKAARRRKGPADQERQGELDM